MDRVKRPVHRGKRGPKKGWILGVGVAVVLAWALAAPGPASCHCEIPCGIYDDPMRFAMMREDLATIEKSMREIVRLGKEAHPDYNQIVRWVRNKEAHADKFREVVTGYFMAQRVKPVVGKGEAGYEAYVRKLTLLHRMVFYSMKCKQTTDPTYVERLREVLEAFAKAYLGP